MQNDLHDYCHQLRAKYYLYLDCNEKQISHCGECDEFPCGHYIKWIDNLDHHKKAMEYLLSLRTNK